MSIYCNSAVFRNFSFPARMQLMCDHLSRTFSFPAFPARMQLRCAHLPTPERPHPFVGLVFPVSSQFFPLMQVRPKRRAYTRDSSAGVRTS